MNKLLPAILLIFTLILGGMAWAAHEASKTFESEAQARVQALKTSDILYHLRRVRRSAVNAETGQRGFLLSGDKSYLEPYYLGQEEYQESITALKDILGDDMTPLQMERLPFIEQSIATKFTIMAKTITLKEKGQSQAAVAVVNTDRGLDFMNEMRDDIQLLIDEETHILRDALAAADRRDKRVQKYLKWIVGLGLALLAIAIFLIWRAGKLVNAEAHIKELEEANAKTELVARELNHRIKNLFAIVLSIVRNTGRMETDVKTANDKIQDRIHALAKAHELTISSQKSGEAELKTLIEKIMEPYLTEAHLLDITADTVVLDTDQITPIGLVIHELTTNAVKYGAWSEGRTGTIYIIVKRLTKDRISFTWTETGGPKIDATLISQKGFGSRMIGLSASQLGGTIESEYHADGLRLTAEFAL